MIGNDCQYCGGFCSWVCVHDSWHFWLPQFDQSCRVFMKSCPQGQKECLLSPVTDWRKHLVKLRFQNSCSLLSLNMQYVTLAARLIPGDSHCFDWNWHILVVIEMHWQLLRYCSYSWFFLVKFCISVYYHIGARPKKSSYTFSFTIISIFFIVNVTIVTFVTLSLWAWWP